MKTVITGGAGFVGSSAARRFLQQGHEVVVIDNFSRRGSRNNVEWLKRQGRLEVYEIDLRDRLAVCSVFKEHTDAGLILHLAAQVAVTTSVADPVLDFEVNAIGTFNLLEAVRVAGIR